VELNDFAARYFTAHTLPNKHVILPSTTAANPSTAAAKSVFKLTFNRRLFTADASAGKLGGAKNRSLKPPALHYQARLTLLTNFSRFDIPLFIYDGLLKFTLLRNERDDAKFDNTPSSHDENNMRDITLNGVQLNTTRVVAYEMSNFNPVEIRVDKFELRNLLGAHGGTDNIDYKIETLFLYYEPLGQFLQHTRHNASFYRVHVSDQAEFARNVRVPAHSRLVLNLTIRPFQRPPLVVSPQQCSKTTRDCHSKKNLFLSTGLNKYSLTIKTKYQTETFKIEFKCANGSIDLVNKNETKLGSITYETFPFGGSTFPIYLQSKFAQTLKIDSIEFTEFGNAFSFKWNLIGYRSRVAGSCGNRGCSSGISSSSYYIGQESNENSDTEGSRINYYDPAEEERLNKGQQSPPPSPAPPHHQSVFVNSYGIIKGNASTFIGQLSFNSKLLCQPACYLGLEPKLKTSSSIIDISSIKIKNLNSLENLDESFIYELWLKSLDTYRLKYSSAHDLDLKLLEFYHKRWTSLNKKQSLFRSNLKIHVNLDQNATDFNYNSARKADESSDDGNSDAANILTYTYPVKFKFKWPSFVRKTPYIEFPLAQLFSSVKTKNITVSNPSNSSVLVQVMLSDAYATKDNVLALVNDYSDVFFSSLSHQQDSLSNEKLRAILDGFRTAADLDQTENNVSAFSLNLKSFLQQHLQQQKSRQQQSQQQFNYESESRKNSVVFLLDPYQTTTLQVKFKPEKMGTFRSFLIIRNNLTIVDVYPIQAEVGSAKLKIEDMAPLRTSVFFDGRHSAGNHHHVNFEETCCDDLASDSSSSSSSLLIKMNDRDFKLCRAAAAVSSKPTNGGSRHFKSMSPMTLTDHLAWGKPWFGLPDLINNLNYNRSELEAEWKQLIPTKKPTEFHAESDLTARSVRLNQGGIVLRNFFRMVNHGNTDLNVHHMLLDGQPCASKGFEIAFCSPFTVGYTKKTKTGVSRNNTAVIEVRYQPDFTISYARKRLTLVTNIGELDYLIEVKIPNYMLTACHDSLPRPLLETCLLILFVVLTTTLLCIMLVAALIESKSIVQFHLSVYKRVFASYDEDKLTMAMHEFGAPPNEFLYENHVQLHQNQQISSSSHQQNQYSSKSKTAVKQQQQQQQQKPKISSSTMTSSTSSSSGVDIASNLPESRTGSPSSPKVNSTTTTTALNNKASPSSSEVAQPPNVTNSPKQVAKSPRSAKPAKTVTIVSKPVTPTVSSPRSKATAKSKSIAAASATPAPPTSTTPAPATPTTPRITSRHITESLATTSAGDDSSTSSNESVAATPIPRRTKTDMSSDLIISADLSSKSKAWTAGGLTAPAAAAAALLVKSPVSDQSVTLGGKYVGKKAVTAGNGPITVNTAVARPSSGASTPSPQQQQQPQNHHNIIADLTSKEFHELNIVQQANIQHRNKLLAMQQQHQQVTATAPSKPKNGKKSQLLSNASGSESTAKSDNENTGNRIQFRNKNAANSISSKIENIINQHVNSTTRKESAVADDQQSAVASKTVGRAGRHAAHTARTAAAAIASGQHNLAPGSRQHHPLTNPNNSSQPGMSENMNLISLMNMLQQQQQQQNPGVSTPGFNALSTRGGGHPPLFDTKSLDFTPLEKEYLDQLDMQFQQLQEQNQLQLRQLSYLRNATAATSSSHGHSQTGATRAEFSSELDDLSDSPILYDRGNDHAGGSCLSQNISMLTQKELINILLQSNQSFQDESDSSRCKSHQNFFLNGL
jgi:hypothetical protein